jgi:hypothetical protein
MCVEYAHNSAYLYDMHHFTRNIATQRLILLKLKPANFMYYVRNPLNLSPQVLPTSQSCMAVTASFLYTIYTKICVSTEKPFWLTCIHDEKKRCGRLINDLE